MINKELTGEEKERHDWLDNAYCNNPDVPLITTELFSPYKNCIVLGKTSRKQFMREFNCLLEQVIGSGIQGEPWTEVK